jgi:transcriptional regulator with XRE-family HTH domain
MTTPPPFSAAEELKKQRLRLDYSQEEMARALGLTLRTYQRYESGETAKVSFDIVEKAKRLKRGA